jgi:hypothetical protein
MEEKHACARLLHVLGHERLHVVHVYAVAVEHQNGLVVMFVPCTTNA